MEKTEVKLYSINYRLAVHDTYYTVKYVPGSGWFVDGMFSTPMVEGLGTKMYEMAVNVLTIWVNSKRKTKTT